ncbi:MAG: 2-dehydropantoate 2-reductase, partial [Candidatus Thermoplasmatota archaeon]|nr:2-dehydropantoate 2-reductase [Candidatus Thermoplasmatota archaeon]
MRFLVFGAGAMGSLVGGLLSQQHETVLVGREAHVEAIRKRGLRITGKTRLTARPAAVEGIPPDADPDVVIVAVKAYDTEDAARTLGPLTGNALFLSLQNGLGNEETLAA